jgi:hypothetical protein
MRAQKRCYNSAVQRACQTRERGDVAFGKGKKEAPAIDEGEEARLCGGLWTNSSLVILPVAGVHVNRFAGIF